MNVVNAIYRARDEDWALGQFNMSNLETLQAIVAAANVANSPVIVGVSMGTLRHVGLDYLRGLVEGARAESQGPLYFHLDHGADFATVQACIGIGFDSVMIDASTLPMQENIEVVRRVVEYAHARGVGVEAQIGETWDEETGEQVTVKTDPAEAEAFVDHTGIDYLAISFGNTPGRLSGQAAVDVGLIRAVAERVQIPIVLHGGTSIPDEAMVQGIRSGASKVNIDTALRQAVTEQLQHIYGADHVPTDPRKAFSEMRKAVEQVVIDKMELFGSMGKFD